MLKKSFGKLFVFAREFNETFLEKGFLAFSINGAS